MSEEIIERKYKSTKKSRLEMSNIRGAIVIKGTEDSEIHVTAKIFLDSGDPEVSKIDIHQDGDVVYAKSRNESPLNWHSKPCRVDFFVNLPKRIPLTVSSVNSSVDISDLLGEVDIKNVSGKIKCSNLNNALIVKSVSGPIRIEGSTIQADLNTVSADIIFGECTLSKITCGTVSGNVISHANLTQGPYQFKSVSGDATLYVPPDSGFDVTFKSLSGRILTSLKTSEIKRSGGVRKAILNKGDVQIHHKNVSGKLIIAYEETDKLDDPFNRTLSGSDRLELLGQVGRGEISVDDAIEEYHL